MSEFIEQVRALIRAGDVRISEHGYDELAEDGLTARELLVGIQETVVVEESLNAKAVTMKQRKKSKYVHEGQYVVEVEVALVEDDTGWSPYLSVEDAYKLDDVRDALRRGDMESASRYGRIYELRPLAHK